MSAPPSVSSLAKDNGVCFLWKSRFRFIEKVVGELLLRRRKKCSPSLPVSVPQALDFTGFLTISGRSCFLRKPLFYPGAISRKLAELILAVGHFPGSFAKTSKLTGITFLKYPQFTKKSSVLLNSIPCCNSVHTLDDFFAHCRLLRL